MASAADLLKKIDSESLRSDIPDFAPGDTLRVHTKIVEGNKERIQIFEGIVLSRRRGTQKTATFNVRKISSGVGVERTFPLYSPRIDKIEIVSRGVVRRSKLFYLRELSGKSARIRKRHDDETVATQSAGSSTSENATAA